MLFNPTIIAFLVVKVEEKSLIEGIFEGRTVEDYLFLDS
jgi:hypothetical protein